jgi:RNA polymerase sigma-70 factor (ECF subfamily)
MRTRGTLRLAPSDEHAWRLESRAMWHQKSAQEKDAKPARFEAALLPHIDAAYNLARWLTGSPSDADDVVQEAFLRAFRFFDGFEGEEAANARAWLLRIVRNTWFTEWRRRLHKADSVSYDDELHTDDSLPGWIDESGNDPETLAVRRDEIHLIHRALEALPVAYREVLVLRELEDMSYRDVAAVIGVPIGTVMSRLSRARPLLAAAVRAAQGAAGERPGVRLVKKPSAGSAESGESRNGQ